MEFIDPQLLESSTGSETEVQPAIANAATEAQLHYLPREDGYVFQGHLPSYCHLTDFASPYPEAPLMESGFDFNNFDPYAPIPRSVAPDFTLPTYPQAPEPWSVTYPNFAPPPFPAGYPTSTVPVPQRPLPGTPVNEHFARLQARKDANNPGQSKNRGRKQPVGRPKGRKVKQPLLPEEAEKLTKPLSQLALDSPHIRVFDMNEHVRRDADKRMTLRRGEYKVRRPSNSFVLYRKAYSDHIKALVGVRQNAISRLAGASWKIESKEVKNKFDEYALEESRQHHTFFPSYKYLPAHKNRLNAEAEADNETVLDEAWEEQ